MHNRQQHKPPAKAEPAGKRLTTAGAHQDRTPHLVAQPVEKWELQTFFPEWTLLHKGQARHDELAVSISQICGVCISVHTPILYTGAQIALRARVGRTQNRVARAATLTTTAISPAVTATSAVSLCLTTMPTKAHTMTAV